MRKRKKQSIVFHLSLLYLWVLLSLTGIVGISLVLLRFQGGKSYFTYLMQPTKTIYHYLLYSQLISVPEGETVYGAEVTARDARVLIIKNYLQKYNSPMLRDDKNIASLFVEMADKYQLPWTLLPAIAQCESNLGKHTPPDCYNAWGYGIHSKGTLCFSSWEEGVKRVARGLSQDYLRQGLVDPKKIMLKYTPVSNGSWAKCVDHFTQELKRGIE